MAVAPTETGLEVVWETLTDDLKAVQAGKLSLVVNEEPAGIRWVPRFNSLGGLLLSSALVFSVKKLR